jgi:hypothetical protein
LVSTINAFQLKYQDIFSIQKLWDIKWGKKRAKNAKAQNFALRLIILIVALSSFSTGAYTRIGVNTRIGNNTRII